MKRFEFPSLENSLVSCLAAVLRGNNSNKVKVIALFHDIICDLVKGKQLFICLDKYDRELLVSKFEHDFLNELESLSVQSSLEIRDITGDDVPEENVNDNCVLEEVLQESINKICLAANAYNSSSSSLLFVDLELKDRKYACLVDSGSNVSILSESIAKEHKLVITDRKKFNLEGLGHSGGSGAQVIGSAEVVFSMGEITFLPNLFYVVPDSLLPNECSIFMGYDMLARNKIDVDYGNKTLVTKFSKDSYVYYHAKTGYSEVKPSVLRVSKGYSYFSNVKCTLESRIELEPGCNTDFIAKVKVHLPIDLPDCTDEYFLEPRLNLHAPLQPQPTLMTASRSDNFYVKFCLKNPVTKQFVVKKGTTVAHAFTLFNDDVQHSCFKVTSIQDMPEKFVPLPSKVFWTMDKIKSVFPLSHLDEKYRENFGKYCTKIRKPSAKINKI